VEVSPIGLSSANQPLMFCPFVRRVMASRSRRGQDHGEPHQMSKVG